MIAIALVEGVGGGVKAAAQPIDERGIRLARRTAEDALVDGQPGDRSHDEAGEREDDSAGNARESPSFEQTRGNPGAHMGGPR